MTLLGDISQAIYSDTTDASNILAGGNFFANHLEKITLTRSYRSTEPIVNFSKGILKNAAQIEAFNREGMLPTVTEVKNESTLDKMVVECISMLQTKGYQTIAVICKTAIQAEGFFKRTKNTIDLRLIDKFSSTFESGVVVLPSYLAKGIEFDAVIIYNASEKEYSVERKILYTACTRVMHELHVFSVGKITSLIQDVNQNTFEYHSLSDEP
ncbi:ATP-binding domain-containing protein [Cytobacillus spongiae]|uniref:ATP-binding domain-containing protein n=1 Tax=Cytobacillus spongiae TaxID=2901381 RepID=UPI001F25844B|nr:ATP-binding domain-containing protein [Cytobacillus spongiae]UII57784.1 ATP-binding domain-containing protein [Cytobacillus spongiae]